MTGDDDVLSFIRRHIRSVWALELLLKLKGDPDRCWTVDELVDSLRASHALVDDSLRALMEAELVVRDDKGCFRYGPAAPALRHLCDSLEETYRVRPVTVIRWISAPVERLKSLADAFRFTAKPADKPRGGDK